MTKVKDPIFIEKLLTEEDHSRLIEGVGQSKDFKFQEGFSRYIVTDEKLPLIAEISNKLIPKAREIFGSDTLMPTYALFAHYQGQNPSPSLARHKDENACTYTLDLCLYQKESWDLWVDGKSYTLFPNQALAYYGEDQEHWREEFPNPETNHVAMVFFHYAEPDHWFFTKGESYVLVIRGEISEDEWLNHPEGGGKLKKA